MNDVEIEAGFERVLAPDDGDRIGDLVPGLVRFRSARERIELTVVRDVRETYIRTGRVGSRNFEVAAPLIPQVVHNCVRERGVQVRDENSLVIDIAAIGLDRIVI